MPVQKINDAAGNLERVVLSGPEGSSAEIYLFGATVTSWKSKGQERLFVSRLAKLDGSKAVRGGIPLVFPQFGPGELPQHGFARNQRWAFLDTEDKGDGVVARFQLTDSEETRASKWPFRFSLEYTVDLTATTLSTVLSYENTDSREYAFTSLMHTYFRVPEIAAAKVVGLKGVTYADKVRGASGAIEERDEVTVAENEDRVYSDVPGDVEVRYGDERVSIKRFNFKDIVFWNPWSEKAAEMSDFGNDELAALGLLLVTLLIGAIAAHSYFNGQPDVANCGMSYSRPQFIEQTRFDKSWTRFADKYKLYLYREGGYDAFDEPSRIPVLFIPGNAGSHKQVRSVAAASAAAFVELVGRDPLAVDRGQIGYDYFTVGLNEEFTALHGYSILEQADFINDAIRYILSLYPETRKKYRLSKNNVQFALPASVIVVGHSMGGIVARTAFTLPNHIVGSVQAIFTLATPHNNPTASLEYYVDKVYSGVNSFWRHGFNNGTLDSVSLVSIAGGNLDSMINSDYTYVGDLAPHKNSLSILSSGINDVWLSNDHQSILWCSQMATKFAYMMMLIMDARRPSQLIELDKRMDVMRQQLFSGLEDDFAATKPHKARKTTSSSYLFSHVHDSDAILLTPADILMLLPPSERDRPGINGADDDGTGKGFNSVNEKSALHLLPIDSTIKNPIVQLIYNPQVLTASENPDDIDAVIPRLVGCNRGKEFARRAQHGSDGDGDGDVGDVSCETIPAARPARLPMKRDKSNPDLPVANLHYLEASTKALERFAYLGLELPSRPGPYGFLRATIASEPEQLK
ncbi:GPI inositol deacylase, partial [Dipsacomyces acuminosporus]